MRYKWIGPDRKIGFNIIGIENKISLIGHGFGRKISISQKKP